MSNLPQAFQAGLFVFLSDLWIWIEGLRDGIQPGAAWQASTSPGFFLWRQQLARWEWTESSYSRGLYTHYKDFPIKGGMTIPI